VKISRVLIKNIAFDIKNIAKHPLIHTHPKKQNHLLFFKMGGSFVGCGG
jgi:hypothetical protein